MKLLILLAFSLASEACSCADRSSNDAFCSSDFVTLVKVISKKNLSNHSNGSQDVAYTVKHIKTYRKTFNGTELSPQILTASNSAACGIELENGRNYLFGGRADINGSLRSNLCGIVKRWRDVTTNERQALLTYQCKSPY